jgi:E3 ubiquitin-protein ligase TRIP12
VDVGMYNSLTDLLMYHHLKKQIDACENLSESDRDQRLSQATVKNARIEDLCLNFTLPGRPDIELIDRGSDVDVDLSNVGNYVDLVLDMVVGDGIRHQMENFKRGFDKVFPLKDMRSFSVSELSIMLGGSSAEDWTIDSMYPYLANFELLSLNFKLFHKLFWIV